ncbi:MAG TPA: hypothetical protein PKJ85_05790 [Nitrosomonas nitrosa]|nr:hypothetical protein [Nitrosomonas sp.]HNP51293.1 hypothetical protein [Nitrosomonas nitrosa]
MQTNNCAIMTPDVLVDLNSMVNDRKSVTPDVFHALNSLVEAVVFHEKIYIYGLPTNFEESELYDQLVQANIIYSNSSEEIFEAELKSQGMEDVASNVLMDRSYGQFNVSYDVGNCAPILSALVEYEKHLGFQRMSNLRSNYKNNLVYYFASIFDFNPEDVALIDDTYRRARAFSLCASELNLEMYTGIIMRPFVLGFLSDRRRGALDLYQKIQSELNDIDNTLLPRWRRFYVPPLTQILLSKCKDSPNAIPTELLNLRKKISKFRTTLTEQVEEFKNAETLGKKRRVQREHEKAWRALLEREDKKDLRTTRLSHIFVRPRIFLNEALESDRLNQTTLQVKGLTDLWRIIDNAPTIEQNIKLIKNVFRVEINESDWHNMTHIIQELESLMIRNEEPDLPDRS